MLPFDKFFCTIRKVSNPDPNIHILCRNKGRDFHHSSHHCQIRTALRSNNRHTNRRPENKELFSAMFCLLAALIHLSVRIVRTAFSDFPYLRGQNMCTSVKKSSQRCKKSFQMVLVGLLMYESPSYYRYKDKTKRSKVKAKQKVVQNSLPEKPVHNPPNKLKKLEN